MVISLPNVKRSLLHFVTFSFMLLPVEFQLWDFVSTKIPVPIYHFQVITWMVPCEWLWKWSPHTSCCSPCAPCWSWALFTTLLGSYISMCGARSLVSATWHDSNIHSSQYSQHTHCSKLFWQGVNLLVCITEHAVWYVSLSATCASMCWNSLVFSELFFFVCLWLKILPPPSSCIRLTLHLFHQTRPRCCGI